MPAPIKLDRDALHRYLFRKADDRGRLKIHIGELEKELGLGRGHMNRILKEMVDAGRLRKAKAGAFGVYTYAITDPDEWAKDKNVGRPRAPVWG